MKVGLEIHQQLASGHKLFCSCPAVKSEDLPLSFERTLRPAQSETGKTDPAAVFEFSRHRVNQYHWSPESACLVEADEEPPHPINEGALETAVIASQILGSKVIDEVHVMRKIVIDGSNTTGFQRTASVGLGGSIEVDGVRVGVQSVTLEEDAARILGEDSKKRRFALDRLGVPLVEVALDPVEGSPEFVGRVALQLGRILRSTKRVARGLGTIRQDLNISVAGGRVVEVKGVQRLQLIPKVVEYELRRQVGLQEAAVELKKRGAATSGFATKEVTRLFSSTRSSVLSKELARNSAVLCVAAPGFQGMFGWEPSPGVRLGKEIADVARASGLGGVIHSDEFEKQGVSSAEAASLHAEFGGHKGSGFVLVAGPRGVAEAVCAGIVLRLQAATAGVPAETRAATDSGETRYLRPRPGAQRMYPETDVPMIVMDPERLELSRRSLPKGWDSEVVRLEREYTLSRDMALKVYDSDLEEDFERITKETGVQPSVAASILAEAPTRLAREGLALEPLGLEVLEEVISLIGSGRLAKEAAIDVMRAIAKGSSADVESAVVALGLGAVGEEEVLVAIERVIARDRGLILERGERSFSPLMGELMRELRGKADGALVSRLLKKKMDEVRGSG